MSKPRLMVNKPAKLAKQEQHQTKLVALANKKKQGKLTLEDLDAKLDVVIKMLQDLMPPK